MKVFEKHDGYMTLNATYYPGMVELLIIDNWLEVSCSLNMSMTQWRAMNAAVDSAHNGYKREELDNG